MGYGGVYNNYNKGELYVYLLMGLVYIFQFFIQEFFNIVWVIQLDAINAVKSGLRDNIVDKGDSVLIIRIGMVWGYFNI